MVRGRVSARLPTYFLLQESRQRAAPLLPPTPSLRCGATCDVNLLGLCGKTHCERRSPFKHIAADLMTMLLHSAVQPPAPRGHRRRRGHKGQYRARDSFFVFLIAACAIWISARGQFRHKSNRSSVPAITRVSAPAACGSGCVHWHRRVPMHRDLTCRRLLERSAASAKRVGRHRRLNGVTQVCP